MLPLSDLKFNPKVLLPCLTSVFFGFILRVCLDSKNANPTWRLVSIQLGIALGLCFGMYIAHRDYKWPISIELLLFLTSFFSVYVVTLLDKWGKFGIRNILTIIAKRYLAETEMQRNIDKDVPETRDSIH